MELQREAADMRMLLGGKGANLAEMNLIGVPVPAGFTITTEVCHEYYELGEANLRKEMTEELERNIKQLEGNYGRSVW